MSAKMRVVGVSVAMILNATGVSVAQRVDPNAGSQREPDTHRGFWLTGGLGGGWADGEAGIGVYYRLGGTPSSRFLLGGETIVWSPDSESEAGRANVTAVGLWYPTYRRSGQPGHDWFVKAGVGFAFDDTGSVDREGFGVTLGTGYDFRIGNNLYLTPNLDLLLQFFEGSTDPTVLLTLGIGFH